MFTQQYGGVKSYYQMVGTGSLEASDAWTKELAAAEAENAQRVKAAQEAKAERDAKGPGPSKGSSKGNSKGKEKRKRDGTGDVSAPVSKSPRHEEPLKEQISGVQGFRAIPKSEKVDGDRYSRVPVAHTRGIFQLLFPGERWHHRVCAPEGPQGRRLREAR